MTDPKEEQVNPDPIKTSVEQTQESGLTVTQPSCGGQPEKK